MTIMCVATAGTVPGVRACSYPGEHRITCMLGESCRGCLPRAAERGFLCAGHYDDVEHAYSRWDEWSRLIRQVGERAQKRDTAGRGSSATGFVPFPGWRLSYDECTRLLASMRDYASLLAWVSTESGARDAIQFARAAERAYRDHEIRERPHRIPTVRCPDCRQKSLVWLPPAYFPSEVHVRCQNATCGRDLSQQAFEVIAHIERGKKSA